MSVKEFMDKNFHHFNAGETVRAAKGLTKFIRNGGKLMVTMAGAMSTARMGIPLAEMIRRGYVHAITCTGANLEEDMYLLLNGLAYEPVKWREISPEQDQEFVENKRLRITDILLPEDDVLEVDDLLAKAWQAATLEGNIRKFPHEWFYDLFETGLIQAAMTDRSRKLEDSWLYAAWQNKLPIYVPGWEDSTEGNSFVSRVMGGEISGHIMKTGLEYMAHLAEWYEKTTMENLLGEVGFFQIGGGIAGDFPICVVPLLKVDLEKEYIPHWGYFCQIGDSTTSYGSYSGAPPSEKITWDKINLETPRFMIESDATIVAPLIFNYVMEALNA